VNRQVPLDFDKRASAIARDAGIQKVERSTGEWQVDALAAIRAVAYGQPELTTDDIWKSLGRDAEIEGRAMGAAMRAAAKYRLVEKTPRTTKSHRVACHRRDLRVWKSLIFKGST
jgi:hypothetical protein